MPELAMNFWTLFRQRLQDYPSPQTNYLPCLTKQVEAWSADKAAEALRCQKLLVEEEDAAQKRQAEIMETKRMKKLRQKEQRSKDLKDEDVVVQIPELVDGATGSTGIQSLEVISGLCEQEDPQHLRLPAPTPPSEDSGPNGDDATCHSAHGLDTNVVSREQAMSTSNLDRLENLHHGSTASVSAAASKHPSSAKHPRHRDPNDSAASNRSKTWAWKVRADVEEQCPKPELDADGGHEMALNTDKSSQLLIGSISFAIEDGSGKLLQGSQPSEDYPTPDSSLNHPVVKVMQPISHDGNNVCEDSDAVPTPDNQSPSSAVTDESGPPSCYDAEQAVGGDSRGTVFSSKEASVFLSQRKHLLSCRMEGSNCWGPCEARLVFRELKQQC